MVTADKALSHFHGILFDRSCPPHREGGRGVLISGSLARRRAQSMWAAIYHIANSEGPPSEIPADLHHAAQAFLDACFHRDVTRRANCVELLASEFCNPIAVPPYTAS